jgi:cold shock CspA family protein
MQAAGVMSGGGSSYEPQQVKRSYEAPSSYGNGKGSSLDPYYSYGKSMSKEGKDGMKGKSAPPSSFEGKGGKPPMKMAKTEGDVENPGLLKGEIIYTGTVKNPPNPSTGYGFISDETISQMYGGKDAFLHSGKCPWVDGMNLKVGDAVTFNLADDENGNPQITRIVKAGE